MANKPVLLQVIFTMTDLDNKPLAGIPARLVFGSDTRWQETGSGHRVLTNAKGEARFRTSVVLDQQRRKKASGSSGLFERAKSTDHVKVATELAFLNFRWLYTLDIVRFPDGDTMLDGYALYTKDAQGRFTRKAELVGGVWKIADLNGLVVDGPGLPGYDPADFTLDKDPKDPSGRRYTLHLWFRRHPPPVRR